MITPNTSNNANTAAAEQLQLQPQTPQTQLQPQPQPRQAMPNNIFNFSRFISLLKLEVVTHYKTILTFIATSSSILFLYCLFVSIHHMSNTFHLKLYAALLFIGGFWTTSLAFKELHAPERNYIFLTLPSSNCEKFLSKLLLTAPGYVLASLLGYFTLSVIVNGASLLILQTTQPIFNPFDRDIVTMLHYYFVLQSLFLLGSVYFKRHVMSKMILTISCFIIVALLLLAASAKLFLKYHIFTISGYEHWINLDFDFDVLPNFIKAIFWFYLAPFCWLITYLRLTESEL
jgi:hypothetical protein